MRSYALQLGSILGAVMTVAASTTACNADNCLREVRATYTPGRVAQGSADCSSFLIATYTPATVTQTSTVTTTLSFTTSTTSTITAISSSVSTAAITGTTITVYSISGSGIVSKRHTPSALDIRERAELTTVANPVYPGAVTARAEVDKRQQTIYPSAIPTYASACSGAARYSSACSCIGVYATTTTVTAPTTVVTVTLTASTTQTVQASTTLTTVTVSTTTATAYPTTTITVCVPPSYGIIYNGGYASPSPGQSGLAVTSSVLPTVIGAQGCCAACYQTTGCYLYYFDQGNSNYCTLLITSAGSAPDETAHCPNGPVDEYANIGSGYFGFGACAIYEGPPS